MVKFSSQTKKVQDLFKKQPKEQFYLREIARKLKVDPGNLSRTLNNLVNQGILTKSKQGNLVYFSYNLGKHLDFSSEVFLKSSKVKEYFKKIEPEVIKFCQNLIRTPSVSGEDPEVRIARLIYEKAKAIGIRAFIRKPLVMSDFAITIRKVLDERE